MIFCMNELFFRLQKEFNIFYFILDTSPLVKRQLKYGFTSCCMEGAVI